MIVYNHSIQLIHLISDFCGFRFVIRVANVVYRILNENIFYLNGRTE